MLIYTTEGLEQNLTPPPKKQISKRAQKGVNCKNIKTLRKQKNWRANKKNRTWIVLVLRHLGLLNSAHSCALLFNLPLPFSISLISRFITVGPVVTVVWAETTTFWAWPPRARALTTAAGARFSKQRRKWAAKPDLWVNPNTYSSVQCVTSEVGLLVQDSKLDLTVLVQCIT